MNLSFIDMLKKNEKISKIQLLLFILAFAIIGYLLVKAFAASNPNLPGDLNNDNTVNAQDLSLLLTNYGTTNNAGDVNSDGTVNAIDLSILLSHYGSSYTPTVTLGTSLPARMPQSSGTSHIFIAPNGSDSNPGTISAPVQSLAKAVSLAASGSFVEVRGNAGAFTASYQLVNSHCSFSGTNPVTIRTYPGDPKAVFASSTTTLNNVYFGNCSGIRIQNLTFASPYAVDGIKIDSCVNFEISDDIIGPNGGSESHGAHGILVNSTASGVGTSTITSNLQILNNTIFNWYADPQYPDGNHGIYLSEGDKVLVANNVIYNDVKGAGYGVQLGGETNDSWIVNNTIDSLTSSGSASYTGGGIVVWGSTSEKTQTPTNNDIIENNLLTNEWSYAVGSSGGTPGPISIVKNNLAYHNGAPDYQAFYGTSQMFTCLGTNSTTCPGLNLADADPLYTNLLAHNYVLLAGSPAIGKSDPAYTPPFDHNGVARSSTPNLGAY